MKKSEGVTCHAEFAHCLRSNIEEYNTEESSRTSSLLHLRGSLSGKRENDFETGRFHGSKMILGGPLGLRGEPEEKGVTNFLSLLLCTQSTALMVSGKSF